MLTSKTITDNKSAFLAYRTQYTASQELENIEMDIKTSDETIQELEQKAKSAESNKQSINLTDPKHKEIEDSITELQEKIEGYTNLIQQKSEKRIILQQELAELSLKIKTWEDFFIQH